jgi:ketosteroid isomerase-like protein
MPTRGLTLEAARDLFERRRRAWLAEDLDAYLALWAEDMTFGSPVHPEPLRGREAYAELIRRSAAAVRPRRFDFHHLAVQGDMVLAEWTIELEHRDGGSVHRYRGMSVARLRDGLIVEWREYWNPADIGSAVR